MAVCAVTAAGCGSSGRELREVPAGQTAPPRSTSSTVAPPTVPSTGGLPGATSGAPALLPDGWQPGGPMPAISSCEGEAMSPPLRWTGIDPVALEELALVVVDPDADGFVHWIVTGIPPADAVVQAGTAPPGIEGPNGGGGVGWFPLCPPADALHTYELELLGFTAPPLLDPSTSPVEQVTALRQQATTRSLLTGTYQR